MKYCLQTTTNHPISQTYPRHIELLNETLASEGCKTILFKDEKALNLDRVELSLSKERKSPEPTMDIAIGLSRDGKDSRILLTEMKFRVSMPFNIRKDDIDKKISHSVSILSFQPPIYEQKVLLFDKRVIAQAKAHIARLYGKRPGNKIQVMTVEEFKKAYF